MPVNFSPADAKRIADTVRRVEKMPHNKPANRRRHVTGRTPTGVLLGKTDAAIAKGNSGTVSRYKGASGTETDTTINDTVKNRFGNVAINKWVSYVLIDGTYYLIAAECG